MLTGFGNHFASEAVAGALPVGRNSPQHVPFGLYAEQLSGTAFTAPRADNRRSWLYRLRPTAQHAAFVPVRRRAGLGERAVHHAAVAQPPALGPAADPPTGDFVAGLTTYAGNGDVATGSGVAVHGYTATRIDDRGAEQRRRRAADRAAGRHADAGHRIRHLRPSRRARSR